MNLEQLSGTETKERARFILTRLGFSLKDYQNYVNRRVRYNFPQEVVSKYNNHLRRIQVLKKCKRYVQDQYVVNLNYKKMPTPYIKAGMILYFLETGLNLTEVSKVMRLDHTSILYYRDTYQDFSNRLFDLIKDDVYKLLSEYEKSFGLEVKDAITK